MTNESAIPEVWTDANDQAVPVITHDGSLYDYTSASLCGVLVKDSVMRQLVRLQSKHLEDVKRLLMDEADKGNVFPSMWTLHYPKGVQTAVKYIDSGADVRERIQNATRRDQPRREPLVFIASSMDEAKAMADARLMQPAE